MRYLRRSAVAAVLVLVVALAVVLTQQSSTGAPKHEMKDPPLQPATAAMLREISSRQHRELDPQARQLRHAPHAVLPDRSRARHRCRRELALRRVLALRGGVGRPHDRREADASSSRDAAAGARADAHHQRRRDAARHPARVGRPHLRRQRPLRLALHRCERRGLRRPGRQRRRLRRRGGARGRARDGEARRSTPRSSSWPSRARSRGCSARRSSPSRPGSRAATSRACSPTTSSAARSATTAGATRSACACSPRASRPARPRSRPRSRRSIGGENDWPVAPARALHQGGRREQGDEDDRAAHLPARPLPARRRPDPVPRARLRGGALHRAERGLRPPAPGRAGGERRAVRRPARVRRLRLHRPSRARERGGAGGARARSGAAAERPRPHGSAHERHGPRPGRPSPEPDLAGYEVVWRETTEPAWTHSIRVGNVTSYTVEGMSKDNFQFGVRAVDRDGNRSPVSFPLPG